MSKETAIAFIKETSYDPILQEQLRKLRMKDLTGLLKIANQQGFKFNQDHLKEALTSNEVTRLSQDLEQVVGPLYVWKMDAQAAR